ncbi:MAG: hypothetical protein A3D92_15480 [Bacteroidetes bacterium RIFCSPHIGHO2_02_FULL_44_7]|nr:MAG: hypothetical protein A3D92_15480 [Bacteroidetes bacterium RIFCSPHIGHO2_02_FULL_44_7]
MKSISLVFLLVFGLSACTSESAPNEETEPQTGIAFFQGSWEEALTKAKTEKKLIFLDAYTEWCGPCKQMSKSVFTNEQLGAYFNENFVCYKMDMEKGEGPRMAQKLGVDAYPSLFFLDGKEKVISTNIGFHTADQLMDLGKIHSDQVD